VNEDSIDVRKIEVFSLGFCSDLFRSTEAVPSESNLMSKVDIEVNVELSSVSTTATCYLSDVMTRLSYRDYLALRNIVRDNVGRKSDRDHWDNLEKAWEKESNATDLFGQDSLTYSVDVTYSSSARVVRYGREKSSRATASRIKFIVSCGSIALILSNDTSFSDSEEFYEMIGIRVHSFDFEVGRKEGGEEWLNLSLGNVFVVDLGKDGRCARMNIPRNGKSENLDSLSVLVEGYTSQQRSIALESTIDSHLVVKIDRDLGASRDVNVVIIISFLSVTLFREPIQDLLSFAMCKWTSDVMSSTSQGAALLHDNTSNMEIYTDKATVMSFCGISDIKIRFVSHYARFVLAADELDPHSRSLMLRG
jgi:hypothetical protein